MYFVTGMLVMYLILWVRHAWDQRRQPIRRDAPTGNKPWVKPEPRLPR
jgi:hypothetical protein